MGCESVAIPIAIPNIGAFIRNRNTLQIILYNAGLYIPVKQESVLAELTNASVEYMTGKEGQLGFGGPKDYGFEARVHKYFKNAVEDANMHLHQRIFKSIEYFTGYMLDESNLYSIFKQIRDASIEFSDNPDTETFALSETSRSKISYQIYLQFYPDELTELKEIGRLMQKYIVRDLNSMARRGL